MKNKKEIKFMAKVAKEIILVEFPNKTTMFQVRKKFYEIMRKYGIKEGTENGNGRSVCNYEWTMCKILFIDTVKSSLQMSFFGFETPKDLEQY